MGRDNELIKPGQMLFVNKEGQTITAPKTVHLQSGEHVLFDPERLATSIGRVVGEEITADLSNQVIRALALRQVSPRIAEIAEVTRTQLFAVGEYEAAERYYQNFSDHQEYPPYRRRITLSRPIPVRVPESRVLMMQSRENFPPLGTPLTGEDLDAMLERDLKNLTGDN